MAEKFQLKNGLTVLLVESHKSPVVSVQMWVRTGSADEPKGQEGISHFIEHLVFKGTKKFKVGEIASQVESHGGELNAYTSFDQTVFYVTISKEFSEKGLEVISEMMGFPSFVSEEIDNEREVVIEEIKRSLDSPHRQASRMLFSTVYKEHPYGLPVIGYEEIIQNVRREEIVDYYQSRYVPDNMTLLVVGDFEAGAMKSEVEKYFEQFASHELREIERPKEPKQESLRLEVKQSQFEESFLYITWRIPNGLHEDAAALDVLALILGQGDSSRLMKSLRIEEPLTNYTASSTYTPINDGFFVISSSLNIKNLKPSLLKIQKEIESILSFPPSSQELKKAITNIESDKYYSLETVDGMANTYGSYERLFNDYSYFEKIIEKITSLTPEDISKLARTYLNPKSLSLCLMTNGEKAQCEKELHQFAEQYSRAYEDIVSTDLGRPQKVDQDQVIWKKNPKNPSEIKKISLSSGASLILKPNYETPIVNLRGAFLGGLRIEGNSEVGLTELLSRVWAAGTEQKTEQQINQSIESMAGRVAAFGGRNTAGLNMTSLSPFSIPLLDLYLEILMSPSLPAEAIEREKLMMLEHLKNRDDNPAQLAVLDFMKAIFGDHPYSRDPYGTNETVLSLDGEKLGVHLNKMRTANNFTMVLAGDFDEDEFVDKLEAMTAKMPKGHKIENTFSLNELKEDQRLYKESQKEQSHIVIGYRGLSFQDPRRYALELMQSILSGQGGRLFIELRDKESLAYSVAPLRLDGIDAGYFGAYIGCSPEKSEKAIEMLKQEFAKLIETKVSSEELERSQRYLIGRHDISLQRTSSMAASILFDDIYGVDYQESLKYAERIRAVTASDIQAIAESIFSQKEIQSVVGSRRPW